ncbi:CocE/NonD family hydrolase [soil metagenome]
MRLSRRWTAVLAAAAVLAGVLTWAAVTGETDPGFRTEESTVPADGVGLDTTLYLPSGATADSPAAAVILAHGFGGSKAGVRADAERLAGQGYVVLAYSARGHGASTGQIGLNSPDFEVADASALIDLLAQRSDVVQDGPGDPRVGISGPSYGGALALLTAGYDDRVDAIVPRITWHSMLGAFFPNAAGQPTAETPAAGPPPAADGVFKRLWAGLFFASGRVPDPAGVLSGEVGPSDPVCGRFRPEVCTAYTEAATTGRASAETAALMERSSPSSVLDRITAPTLLIQGAADSLFPLDQADANARGIAAAGTPVKVAWTTGGHDAADSDDDTARIVQLTTDWFHFHLRGEGPDPGTGFEYAQITGLSTTNGRPTSRTTIAPTYPGLAQGSVQRLEVALSDGPRSFVNPPGGNPAAISTLPGLTQLTSLVGGVSVDIPGQAAVFTGAELATPVQVVGSPTVTVRVASSTGEAVLFAKLFDVDAGGSASLPQGLVAPIRLTGLPATLDAAEPITITMPAIAYRFEVDHRMRLALASTDQAYAGPAQPATYEVELVSELSLPQVAGEPLKSTGTPWLGFVLALTGLAAVVTATAYLLGRRGRARAQGDVDRELTGVPLVISGLTKAYPDGVVAVRDLSFRVEIGQVVGLLGPNGAGKTTTLRMLMGLITPLEGTLRVFGAPVRPGAPVLSRLGSFVEGTGFLPHLSGLDNLRLYWRATGRPPGEAHLDEALEIAGLGAAVDKPVRSYSQGMRQRLAIAQAMLGLPDLLVLDEPTNGLDPPQIREMRDVLRRYVAGSSSGAAGAARGSRRAVLVSSHLLSEVEQTCSHVVVMHHGSLVAQGTVAAVIGESSSVLVGVDDQAGAVATLSALSGVRAARPSPEGVLVEMNGMGRAELVRALVAAGVAVESLTTRRRLEDVFMSLVGEGRHEVD